MPAQRNGLAFGQAVAAQYWTDPEGSGPLLTAFRHVLNAPAPENDHAEWLRLVSGVLRRIEFLDWSLTRIPPGLWGEVQYRWAVEAEPAFAHLKGIRGPGQPPKLEEERRAGRSVRALPATWERLEAEAKRLDLPNIGRLLDKLAEGMAP